MDLNEHLLQKHGPKPPRQYHSPENLPNGTSISVPEHCQRQEPQVRIAKVYRHRTTLAELAPTTKTNALKGLSQLPGYSSLFYSVAPGILYAVMAIAMMMTGIQQEKQRHRAAKDMSFPPEIFCTSYGRTIRMLLEPQQTATTDPKPTREPLETAPQAPITVMMMVMKWGNRAKSPREESFGEDHGQSDSHSFMSVRLSAPQPVEVLDQLQQPCGQQQAFNAQMAAKSTTKGTECVRGNGFMTRHTTAETVDETGTGKSSPKKRRARDKHHRNVCKGQVDYANCTPSSAAPAGTQNISNKGRVQRDRGTRKDGAIVDKSGRWTSLEDKALVQEVVAYLASYGLKSQPPADLSAKEVSGWERQMERDASSIMEVVNMRPSFPSTEPHMKEKHQHQYPHCDQNIDIDLFDSVVDTSYDGDSIEGLIEVPGASPGAASGETATPDAVSVTDRVFASQFAPHPTLFQQNVTASPPTWAFAQSTPPQISPALSQSLAGALPVLYADPEALERLNVGDHANICEPSSNVHGEPYSPANPPYLNTNPLSNAELDRSRQIEQQLRLQLLAMPLSSRHVDCVSTTPACLASLNAPSIPGAFMKAATSYRRQDPYQAPFNHSQFESTQCNHAVSDMCIDDLDSCNTDDKSTNHALLALPGEPALSQFSPLYSLSAAPCESTCQYCSSSLSPIVPILSSMPLTVPPALSHTVEASLKMTYSSAPSPQPHFLVCDAPLASSPSGGIGYSNLNMTGNDRRWTEAQIAEDNTILSNGTKNSSCKGHGRSGNASPWHNGDSVAAVATAMTSIPPVDSTDTESPANIYSAVLCPPAPLLLASSDNPPLPAIPKTSDEYSLAISRAMSLCPWSLISARSIPGRTGVQAQARWSEALDPQVKKGPWGQEEDALLLRGVRESRKCWIWIADTIPGRTQRQCRTRWVQLSTRAERRAAAAVASANEQSPGRLQTPSDQDEGLSQPDVM